MEHLFQDPLTLTSLTIGQTHDRKLVQRLVGLWHSSLGPPVGYKIAFILYCGNTQIGVATWSRPVARLEDQISTLELTRYALSSDAPHNSATRGLALMRRWIRIQMPNIVRLISYQNKDLHRGTIYKADNWRLVDDVTIKGKSWTNRSDRKPNACVHRCKWERQP